MEHSQKGDLAEALAEDLLLQRGYAVRNLNQRQRNAPVVDLEVEGAGQPLLVSVKSCWTPNRRLRLGTPASLERLPDDAFVMAFLPLTRGVALDLTPGCHRLGIIPGAVARDEARAAHWHYAAHNPGSANPSVMVKDKQDRSPKTRSGAVFERWASTHDAAWPLLPPGFAVVGKAGNGIHVDRSPP